MPKRARTPASTLDTPTPAPAVPSGAASSRTNEKHSRKDPAADKRDSAVGHTTSASVSQGGDSDAGAGEAPKRVDDGEAAARDKAAQKAAKAARKAARKAAKEAAAAASVQTAPSGVNEPPRNKSKKDNNIKDSARGGTADGSSASATSDAVPTVAAPSTSRTSSSSPLGSGSDLNSAAALDPSLAGLLRDERAPAFPTGDIPVDPVLLQLRPVPAAAAFAPLQGAGPAKEKGGEDGLERKKEKKAKKDKKGKGRAVLDEAEAGHAPAPAREAGLAGPPAPEKEKKRRGRPPKAASVEGADGDGPKAKRAKTGTAVPLAGSKEDQFYEDLVSKWLNAKQLRDAAEAAGGATYAQGRFTTTEDATIDSIVSAFRNERQYTDAEFRNFLVVKRAAADKALQRADHHDLWERIARALRTRPLLAVYNHVRARYPPPDAESAKGTAWTDEEDQELRRAIHEMGNSWERVGTAVGRTPTACRDRWTKQLNEGREVKKGAWGTDEEEQLRELVGTWGMQWKIVSQKMGGTRTATQCRTKWNDYLKRRDAAAEAGGDSQYKWRPEDSSRLVHLCAPLPQTIHTRIR
ncbi:hypothetical protein JCM3770_006463 [Rhodotorula araucariae]